MVQSGVMVFQEWGKTTVYSSKGKLIYGEQ
jgi:hypothetical protein